MIVLGTCERPNCNKSIDGKCFHCNKNYCEKCFKRTKHHCEVISVVERPLPVIDEDANHEQQSSITGKNLSSFYEQHLL
jgi:hypothetical protein